jgi:hypothetical protein
MRRAGVAVIWHLEIGFFQERETSDLATYWVPFLYRDALYMSQGLADE